MSHERYQLNNIRLFKHPGFMNDSKRTFKFLTIKLIKVALSEGQNLILKSTWSSYIKSFKVEICQKVNFLRSKILHKQLLNNPKATFKNSKNHFLGNKFGQFTGMKFVKIASCLPSFLDLNTPI